MATFGSHAPKSVLMLSSSSCSHALLQRPVLVPPLSRFRVSLTCLTPIWSSRFLDSNPRSLRNNWKIWCFRHEEESSSQTPKTEFSEQFLPEESSVTPEIDNSNDVKKECKPILREAADAVFKAIGSKWTVPWTAETIMQAILELLHS